MARNQSTLIVKSKFASISLMLYSRNLAARVEVMLPVTPSGDDSPQRHHLRAIFSETMTMDPSSEKTLTLLLSPQSLERNPRLISLMINLGQLQNCFFRLHRTAQHSLCLSGARRSLPMREETNQARNAWCRTEGPVHNLPLLLRFAVALCTNSAFDGARGTRTLPGARLLQPWGR